MNMRNNKNRKFRYNKRGKRGNSQPLTDEEAYGNLSFQQIRKIEQKVSNNLNNAKDLLSKGERVDAELYLQAADHFQRILNVAQKAHEERKAEREAQKEKEENKEESVEENTDNPEGNKSEESTDEKKNSKNDDKVKGLPDAIEVDDIKQEGEKTTDVA